MHNDFDQFTDNKRIRVLNLLLQETGTYNPMYIRPYVSHVTKDVIDVIQQRVEQHGTVSANTFAGIASNIIAPSAANSGMIPIPNGWQEKRMSFILTLEANSNLTGNKIIYVQGYTDYLGIATSGAIDPNMRFYINSMTVVSRNIINTPMGAQYSDRVLETTQVINGKLFTEQYQHYANTNNYGVYGLRPYDIFMSSQSNQFLSSFNNLNDTRVRLDNKPMTNKTNRANNLPTNFLKTLVNNYNQSAHIGELGIGVTDVYSNAASLSTDGIGNNNDFIRTIELYTGIANSVTFTIQVLESIESNLSAVTNFIRIGNTQLVGVHTAGESEYWHGANRETVAATLLSNAVPALMLEYMLNKINFRSTNQDITGNMSTIIIDAKSITNLDLTASFNLFKHRLETELLLDLTYGNQIAYMLDMECNIFGESKISISLDSGPLIQYTTPSFCDSLLVPVYTLDKNNLYTLTHDMNQIFSGVNPNATQQQTFTELF